MEPYAHGKAIGGDRLGNYDALYNVLAEYGPEWRLVFRNATAVPKMFRVVCRFVS